MPDEGKTVYYGLLTRLLRSAPAQQATSKPILKTLVAGTDPRIDIVAVHGLNPKSKDHHAERTWTAEKTEKIWLRDFLPKRRPDARVLLFGYNSNVMSGGSTSHVDQHAITLLNKLEHKRRNVSNDRPIIFIAHSLGGLVVKKALVEAKQDERYLPLKAATHGIVFFATPHQGGNLATLGKTLSDIANKVRRDPPSKLVEALKKESVFLEKLNADFRHQLEDYFFVSFFETKFYRSIDVIVDQKSAQLRLAGHRESILAIERDHNEICKYAYDDGEYEGVEIEVLGLVEHAVASLAARKSLSPTEEQERRVSASPFANSPFVQWSRQISSPFFGTNEKALPIFNVPSKKDVFVGRQSLLRKLVEELTSNKVHCRKALYGLGGVGKTDLATQTAHMIKERDPDISVYWILASSFEQTYQSIVKIAKALDIPGADAPNADMFELVKNKLESRKRGRWVMIIDHADDAQSLTLPQGGGKLHQHIPSCSHGSVLLTTRNRKIASNFVGKSEKEDLMEIASLSQKESEELLHHLLDTKHVQDGGIEELTRLLNHFPLAIVQAASFIRGNVMTVRTYLQRYAETKHDALEVFGHDSVDWDNSDSVTTTWMISFTQLQENNRYAAQLLSLMAYLDHNEIPESILRACDDESKTGLRFEDACGDLKAFSFISESPMRPSTIAEVGTTLGTNLYSIQPIVQLVMQYWHRKHNESARWTDAAMVAVSKALPSAESSKEQWKAYEFCLPHVQCVLDHMGDSTSEFKYKAVLLHNASWYYRMRGHHETAAGMARQAISIRQHLFGEEDETTLASVHSLARILFEQGNLEESEEQQIPVIEICERNFGPEHPDTLRNKGHLAAIRGMQGRYEEALELQQNIQTISVKALGDCPASWLADRDLAITLSYMNRKMEAKSLQEYVYSKRREHLGQDHPETLIIMSDLATTYIEQSDFTKAEELLNELLTHSKRILGDSHPHTMDAAKNLTEALRSQGKWNDVRRLEDALRRVERDLKENAKKTTINRRPSYKRAISSSVITYSYCRPLTTLDEEQTEAAGLGLDLALTRNASISQGDINEEEEEEDVEEDNVHTVFNALMFATRGIITLPLFNYVPFNSAEDPIFDTPALTTRSLSSLSTQLNTPQLKNIGKDEERALIKRTSRTPTGASDAASTTSSTSEKPAYSTIKLVRSLEKKYERQIEPNINKQTYETVVTQGSALLADTLKKTNLKSLKLKSRPRGSKKKEKGGDATAMAEPESATSAEAGAVVLANGSTTELGLDAEAEFEAQGEHGPKLSQG